MKTFPSLQKINIAQQQQPWDLGNKMLYDLCKGNFWHDTDDKILAKVWLIGRAYAAAIERRRNKAETNHDFYIDIVAPTLRHSRIDEHLRNLKTYGKLSVEILPQVLETHHYLTSTLFEITELNKRSFSSKYLHFHLPDLFFIYDSRVVTALRQFVSRVPKELIHLTHLEKVDLEYSKFVCKSLYLMSKIQDRYQINLTIRQFDNLLISLDDQVST